MTEIQKKLKQLKDPKTNVNLHDHLKNVISKLVTHNPHQAYEQFEHYSFHLKGDSQQQVVYRVREGFGHLKDYENRNRALLGKINIGTEEQPQQPASIGYVPNIMEEAKIYEKIGIGFGEDQSYRIFKSICRLASKKSAKQVRFWGKIICSQEDYYVAEGIAEGGEEQGEISADTQAKGTGVNKLYYWVTTQLTGEWTQLPVVTPQQLRISRKIKFMFTGNLNNKIITNPHFVGKQAHLLKCQIVRISASSTIVPKGMYLNNADDPKQIDTVEQFKFPDPKTLSKLQNWVHHPPAILKAGRLTHIKPEGMEQQEWDNILKQTEKKDPAEPRLKLLSQDKGQIWKIGSVETENEFKTLSKDGRTVNYGVAYVRSLVWPGWTTIAYLNKTSSIYIGYGFKGQKIYYPCQPETILSEQSDRQEAPEPN